MTQELQKLAKEAANGAAERGDNVLWRLAQYVPLLGHLVARRERELAREQCTVMLQICRTLQREHDGLEGEALYERVVAALLSCDDSRARELVRLADQSFAQWPDERDVNFRDVVNYVIVHQILSTHERAVGTQADMTEIVNAAIPEGL